MPASVAGQTEPAPADNAGPVVAPSTAPGSGTSPGPPPGPPGGGGAGGGRRLLGEILVERRALTPTQLAEALVQQRVSGKRLGAMLVELGALAERELAEALGEHFGVAVVDLRHVAPNEDAIAKLPETAARSLTVIPLGLDGGSLVVAVADPTHELGRELASVTGMPVRMVVASASDIKRAIDQRYRALSAIGRFVDAFQASAPAVAAKRTESPAAPTNDTAPVIAVVNLLVTQAVRDRASDVHLEPTGDSLRVRFRIDGVLHEVAVLPGAMGGAAISRIKVLAGMNIVERRRAQDGQFAMSLDGRDVDIRVASTGTVAGEKVVMRLLDKSKPLYRLSDLGMTEETNEAYSKVIRSPFGMVICAGPTGSGKTTSLYATLGELNSSERNIMTIEDPVEYVFPTINQIQINETAGVSFAGGLRSIMRQDPDVILVGEIRDAETARIAVQSALTGHFVLSSIHATDAASALLRFLDMDIEPFVVSAAVAAVLSQRLVRRICEQCRRPYTPTQEELDFFADAGGDVGATQFQYGEGCTFCAQTGYSDRIGVYELLRVSGELKAMLAARPTHEELRAAAMAAGMTTLRDEAVRLVRGGVTTVSEVIRAIYTL